jgi:hypothetical protein
MHPDPGGGQEAGLGGLPASVRLALLGQGVDAFGPAQLGVVAQPVGQFAVGGAIGRRVHQFDELHMSDQRPVLDLGQNGVGLVEVAPVGGGEGGAIADFVGFGEWAAGGQGRGRHPDSGQHHDDQGGRQSAKLHTGCNHAEHPERDFAGPLTGNGTAKG